MKAELIDAMGDDLTVVNAARVSFDKESQWEVFDDDGEPIIGIQYWEEYKNKHLSEKDEKLIKYLARHNHFTPFTHCVVTLRETVPIFVARQRFKHMVGFSYNEVSRRYVDDPPEYFKPVAWRKRAENRKQGSSDETFDNKWWFDQFYNDHLKSCTKTYEAFIKAGMAPELARMVLPQSMYTSYYVTGSLAAWARAYLLRSDAHAQQEIQDLSKQWSAIIEPLYPISWKALTEKENV